MVHTKFKDICHSVPEKIFKTFLPYILLMTAYLCVIAVQHFLNDPHGEINTGNFPVLEPFNIVVCRVTPAP